MSFPVISPLIGTCCKQPPPMNKCQILAFEGGNSWYFATPTLVSLKRCLRNDCRNSILMTGHYSGLGSASDTQIWVVTCHHYGIFVVRCSQMSFEKRPLVAKSRLFSQASITAGLTVLHWDVGTDHYTFLGFLGNCPPTPPLSQL